MDRLDRCPGAVKSTTTATASSPTVPVAPHCSARSSRSTSGPSKIRPSLAVRTSSLSTKQMKHLAGPRTTSRPARLIEIIVFFFVCVVAIFRSGQHVPPAVVRVRPRRGQLFRAPPVQRDPQTGQRLGLAALSPNPSAIGRTRTFPICRKNRFPGFFSHFFF